MALAQLRELGLGASVVHKRASAGRLHRVHQCVYAIAPAELLSREGRWMAAVLACGPGAVLSHRSAAWLLGLRPTDRTNIDVTIPARCRRQHAGIDVHTSITLTPTDTTRVKNIPCTTVARTQFDLAEVVPRRALERAYDQAEILEVFDLGGLEDQVERNRNRRGVPFVRAVLDEHYAGRTPTWDDFEERFLALCRSAGIPEPELNAWIVLADGEPAIRADFVWRSHRLVVETDGRGTHGTRQAFERDRRRDQRLTLAGWRPIRVSWRQLTREPEVIARLIVALLAAG